jgi:hypothetical protein
MELVKSAGISIDFVRGVLRGAVRDAAGNPYFATDELTGRYMQVA